MKLIKIMSDRIQIKTDLSEFNDVRINELIAVSDSNAGLVTVVTAISDLDTGGAIGTAEEDYILDGVSSKVIECSIIGSVRNGKFSKAIEQYPTTNVEFKKISSDVFEKLISKDTESGFCVGKYISYDVPAWVDGNKFFQRHSCIVGNTGSGKSETVAKILEEASKLKGTNMIVFDIHGEYKELSYARNIKVGKEFSFPIWMFSFNSIISDILKVREESASVVMSGLRKCYYMLCDEGQENKPVYFNFEQFLCLMESLNKQEVNTGEFYKTGDKAGMPKTVKGEFNGKLSGIINTIKDKMADCRYSFMFEEKGQDYFFEIIKEILQNDKPIKNIDLSEVPHDIAIPLISAITKLVYGIQRTYSAEELVPITLVCDEAHVYIPNNFQLSATEKRMVEVFEEIAKEGRKFGISLFPASQRPSELNKTIMAQCANFIVSKLNNENDKSMIKGMLPDGSEDIIDSTTTFSPGEVLIIGDAVPIPIKIKVSLAKERPLSRTIEFWDRWNQKHGFDFAKGIRTYLNSGDSLG